MPAGWNLPTEFSWAASLSEQLRSKRLLRPLLPYERQDRSFTVERPFSRKLLLDGIQFAFSLPEEVDPKLEVYLRPLFELARLRTPGRFSVPAGWNLPTPGRFSWWNLPTEFSSLSPNN